MNTDCLKPPRADLNKPLIQISKQFANELFKKKHLLKYHRKI